MLFPGAHRVMPSMTVTPAGWHINIVPSQKNTRYLDTKCSYTPSIDNPNARTAVKPACSVLCMPREPPPPPFAHGSNGPSPPSHEAWLLPLSSRRPRLRRGRDVHPPRSNCSPRARTEAARWSRHCTGRRHPGQGGKDRGAVGTFVKRRSEEAIPPIPLHQ